MDEPVFLIESLIETCSSSVSDIYPPLMFY